MPEPEPRIDHLEQRIAQLEQAGEAGGGFWAKWRKWGIMRGGNKAGALNAISTSSDPTVLVLSGYEGPVYQKRGDFLNWAKEDPLVEIQTYVSNANGDAMLTLKAFQQDGLVVQDYAIVKLIRDTGSGNLVRIESGDATNVAVYDFPPDGNPTVALNGGSATALGGGALKVQNGGYYLIPAGPAVGTTVASSASANTYGSWTEMRAASGNALYIVGAVVKGLETVQYLQLDIGTGAAASESSVSESKFHGGAASAAVGIDQTVYFPYPIAVAANIRIACRVADEDASAKNATITLIVVDQADVTTI